MVHPRQRCCTWGKSVDRHGVESMRPLRKDDDTSQPANKPPSFEGTANSTPRKYTAPNPTNISRFQNFSFSPRFTIYFELFLNFKENFFIILEDLYIVIRRWFTFFYIFFYIFDTWKKKVSLNFENINKQNICFAIKKLFLYVWYILFKIKYLFIFKNFFSSIFYLFGDL